MLRQVKSVFYKSYATLTLEQLMKKNPPFDIEIFTTKASQKPPQKPEYEDEHKPNPDYNQDYYDKKYM